MIKTLRNLFKQDKEQFIIPKGVQDCIPAYGISQDGIVRLTRFPKNGTHKFSKTFKFTDINYAVASEEDKETMFLQYSELLNSFDSGATTKITINNRKMNQSELEKTILIPMQGDALDEYRTEYNQMLLGKAVGDDAVIQEKYITVSVNKKNITEARNYFSRIGAELASHLLRLGSHFDELDATEKLRIFHDFFRTGEESQYRFELKDAARNGQDFKDFVCPDTFEFDRDHFRMGERYGRVLFLRDYASFIKDDMVDEFTSLNRNMMMSIDIVPVPTDEAVREVESRLLGTETNITNWQRKQNQNNNFSAVIPYDMELQRKESKEFLDDLTTRDQRMMFSVMTLVHTADSLEQLNSDTEALLTIARSHMCSLAILKWQQLDGLNTVLPYGTRRIDSLRTLTTESLAVFIPFKVQNIMDKNGIYVGENAISHNLLMCNKENLMNPNAFLLGVPGSGKSFAAKMLIIFLALATKDDIMVCDPEGEYGELIRALGGEVIRIAAGSRDHINAMDMVDDYGDGGDPVIDKSEFIMSLIGELDKSLVGPKEHSIIDRCTKEVYAESARSGKIPTLITLRKKLLEQPEEEARALALSLELFTSGSLDAFAHPTNVNVKSRMVVYDIFDLGKQLKTMGLLTITDAMINRVTENWKKGKRTHIFVDEFHVVFENEYSGEFFNSAWRRFRKRNAFATAITQNVEYLLDSVLASSMLSNSEFVMMLNQAASDREKLAQLLNISPEQMSYITGAKAGCGLLKYGSSLVPFVNQFPKNTKLYKLMSTKPNEKFF